MALRIAQIEELQALVRATGPLVDEYEARDPRFPGKVVAWLKEAEVALERNQLHVAGLLAQLRGTVLSAQRAGPPTPGSRPEGRRRRRETAALEALREATAVVHEAIGARVAQLEEGVKVARQLMAIAALKGTSERCGGVAGHQARLECLRHAIQQDPDLLPYYAALTGIVDHNDTLVLLDRVGREVIPGGGS